MAIRAKQTRCGHPRWRIASIVLVAVCLAAIACERGRPSGRSGDASDAPRAGSASRPAAGDEPALPNHGTARVRLSASGVTVLANRAPRSGVLEDLARQAGFEVATGAGQQLAGSITLRAVEVPLERALSRLLAGVPYALHYDADSGGEEGTLVRVVLIATDSEGRLARRRERRIESRRPNEARALAIREPPRELADRGRLEEQQWKAIRSLEDGLPEVRVDAAESLYPDAAGIDALAAAVTDDPEPAVRVAAARSLGQSVEDPAALAGLLRALEDPDPRVVVAALDSIAFVGDHTVIPELQVLLEHPNAEVRDATVDAIGWLEE